MEETPKASKSHKVIIISVVGVSIALMLGVLGISVMMNNHTITANTKAASTTMQPATTSNYQNPFASPTPASYSNPFDQSGYQNPFSK